MKSKLLLAVPTLLLLLAGCAPKIPPRVVSRNPPPKTRPAPPPVQPAQPVPVKPAPRQPAPLETPAEAPYDEKEPLLVKVGLASDLDSVTFPCCEEPLQVFVETQEVAATGSLRIEPAAATAQKGFYRLQVAALRDERQAQDLAKRLEKESGQPGEAYFDAGIDLYRILVGRYPTRESAEADLKHLTTMGVTGGFVVNEGGSVTEPALRLTQGGVSRVVPGRWLSVAPAASSSVRVQGKRYRGRMLVYLNDRGALNLINELPVEDYLRGVVPSEMGPEQYPRIEAIKAHGMRNSNCMAIAPTATRGPIRPATSS